MNRSFIRWIGQLLGVVTLLPLILACLGAVWAPAAALPTVVTQATGSARYVRAQVCRTAGEAASHLTAAAGAAQSPLDTTDCYGVVLDDSPFAETTVLDHRDASYGAMANSAMRPLGGGAGYGRIVPRQASVVRTADELRAALLAAARSASSTIYVDDAAEIDLSYCARTPTPRGCSDPRSRPADCRDYSLVVPANTTLASGRGRGASRGARLFSRTFTDCPLLDVNLGYSRRAFDHGFSGVSERRRVSLTWDNADCRDLHEPEEGTPLR